MSDIPTTTQKAWLVVRRGKPAQAVELNTDVDVPSKLDPGEVLVKVQAAALNPVGYNMMALRPNFLANRPHVAEHDLAGVVVDANGTHFENGNPVFGFIPTKLQQQTRQGALQQYARLPASHLAARPPNVPPAAAAGLALAGQTAWRALFVVGGLRDGQRVFVNGGSSSVGACAVQLAKAHGCHVAASASAESAALVKALGADDVLDYTSGALHLALVAAARDEKKYDVLFDAVGSSSPALYTHSPAYLAPRGVYVSTGPQASLSLDTLRTIVSVFLRPAWLGGTRRAWRLVGMLENDPEALEALRALAADGRLKPVVDSVYAFEDVQAAYARIMTRRAKGKVVVRVVAEAE
ncbi:hypothetical protein PLICRDRAFT_139690 [Plicaturopsis crispa FD-325 SS-3]|nr:hypothetical protein PLICRDRAFT_139690 [Plicaturopsis crispa FD-325 SS-3]